MLEVRAATVDDLALVREIRLRALHDAPYAFASTYEREVAFTDDLWRDRIGSSHWVLALDDGRPVGVACGIAVADDDPEERHLVAMYVEPSHRGTRLADRLVDGVWQWAIADGATALALWVADGNDRAARCYERLGFMRTGERQPLPSRPAVHEERMVRRVGGGS